MEKLTGEEERNINVAFYFLINKQNTFRSNVFGAEILLRRALNNFSFYSFDSILNVNLLLQTKKNNRSGSNSFS